MVSFVLDGRLLRTEPRGGDRLLSDRFEQDFDIRPEGLPLLAFLLRQSGQLLLVADAGEVRAFLPVRQSIANLLLDVGLDDLRSLFPGGQLRLQPVEGLTTQPCLRRAVKQRLILALPGGRQGLDVAARASVLPWNGRASQTFAVLSWLPVTIREPSGLNDAEMTQLVCPLSVRTSAPLVGVPDLRRVVVTRR